MKNTLLMLLFATTISVASAYPGSRSSLEIVSYSGPISVSVDRQYFGQPSDHFAVDNIKPGNRYIEIFGIRFHHGHAERVKLFAGRVFISNDSRISAVFDERRGFYIAETRPYGTYGYGGYQGYDTYGYGQDQGYYGYASPVPMSSGQFSGYLDAVDDQWTESNRLQVALQGLTYNWLTTLQVKAVMETFWTESARLEFAKAAYSRVVDPQIYYEVNEVFWSQSSVQELSRYILQGR